MKFPMLKAVMAAVILLVVVLYAAQTCAQEDPETYVAEGQERDPNVDLDASEWPVEAVSMLVCDQARIRDNDTGRCGDWCAPDRSWLSPSFPDRSEWAHSDEDCDDIAESVVYWSTALDIPVQDILTVGLREARFQPYAFGSGGECGMFQQYVQYARPSSMRYDLGCEERDGPDWCDEEDRVRICEWFHADFDNQVFSVAIRLQDYIQEYGIDGYACHYREGGECGSAGYSYQSNHNFVRDDRIVPRLEHYVEVLDSMAVNP